MDFLIPPSLDTDKGGDLRHIEKDFAAVITPSLRLAFQYKRKVLLKGVALKGEKAKREIWVCGPGAFIVLKALAFDQRGENKDAYDLYFVIRNYGSGIYEVCECLHPLLKKDALVAFKMNVGLAKGFDRRPATATADQSAPGKLRESFLSNALPKELFMPPAGSRLLTTEHFQDIRIIFPIILLFAH